MKSMIFHRLRAVDIEPGDYLLSFTKDGSPLAARKIAQTVQRPGTGTVEVFYEFETDLSDVLPLAALTTVGRAS